MEYCQELPKNFDSWVRFYLEVEPLFHENRQFIKVIPNEVFIIANRLQKPITKNDELCFDITFIKQKAFEEMIELYKTFSKRDISSVLNMSIKSFEIANLEGSIYYNNLLKINKIVIK